MKKNITTSMIYLLVFMVLSIYFVIAGSDEAKVFEQVKLDICVFDEDNTPESRELISFIGKCHNLVDIENNETKIIDALYYERVNYVLVIKQGYSQKLASGEESQLFENRHMHKGYNEIMAEQMLNEYVSAVRAYLAGGKDLASAVKSAEEALTESVSVDYKSFDEKSEAADNFKFYFQYLPYIFLCIMINALCPNIMTMNKGDIRYRTECSGIKPASYIMQIFAANTVMVVGVWLLFMLVGMVMYGGIYQGSAWICVLNSFVFMLVSASFSLLISCFAPNGNAINLITQILSLGMSFMCGVFVEQSLLSKEVLMAARFMPAYWYIRVNDMVSENSSSALSDAAGFMLIELAFAVVPVLLTVLIRKNNRSMKA